MREAVVPQYVHTPARTGQVRSKAARVGRDAGALLKAEAASVEADPPV